MERWGEYLLVRPEPQAVWPKALPSEWSKAHMVYHRPEQSKGHWECAHGVPEAFSVRFEGLRFLVKPSGQQMGLFPEQAPNWRWIMDTLSRCASPIRVLNLFGYTGGATLSAAARGASVCHVDASRSAIKWTRQNLELSGLSEAPVRLITDDAVAFLKREIRRHKTYDAVIMDPPSFGRGPRGEVFKLREHLSGLMRLVLDVLSEEPFFVLVTAHTTGLSARVLREALDAIKQKHGGSVDSGELSLQSSGGHTLPCGLMARWQRNRS